MTNLPIAVTRIVNSCVLIEIGGYAVLGDPWFRDRWYLRFGEAPGMCISELPKLAGIIGSHSLPNHWDIQPLGGYAHKATTPVFVSTDQMAKQSKKAGFKEVEVVEWGTTWVAAGFRKMFSILNWRYSMTTNNSIHPRAFLVTGASSGIGRATALLLDRNGFQAFAGVRRSEHGEALRQQASERLLPILLDVTDQVKNDYIP